MEQQEFGKFTPTLLDPGPTLLTIPLPTQWPRFKLERQTRGLTTVLNWVPSHGGVKGNEEADKQANITCRMDGANLLSTPTVRISKAWVIKDITNKFDNLAWKRWDQTISTNSLERSRWLEEEKILSDPL